MGHNPLFYFFYGSSNPLSNWHFAWFTVKGRRFPHVECFMMYCKAMLFGDIETADMILNESDPARCKQLGRQVRGFVEEVWVQKREIYVEIGCFAKFSQNPSKGLFLLSTNHLELVEASKFDTIWGIGLSSDDPRAMDHSKWRGSNLLGHVLERVRSRISRM